MTKNRLAITIQRSHKTFDEALFLKMVFDTTLSFLERFRRSQVPRTRRTLAHLTHANTTRLRTRWVWRSEKDRLRDSLPSHGDITPSENFFSRWRANESLCPTTLKLGSNVQGRGAHSQKIFFGSEKFRLGARRVSVLDFQIAIAPKPLGLQGSASQNK
jgi:hypothetical protein